MYIGVAGNIGSGKSSMAKLLTEEFECKMFKEDETPNPYLASFYADMPRWAFNLQVSFLTKRFKAVQRAMWSDEVVVQDRTLYEDAHVFVEHLACSGLLPATDYRTYRELFDVMVSYVNPPELLIYLRASVPSLMQHIRQRGVSYEASISWEYLTLLNNRYDAWAESYRNSIITVNVDDVDFVNNEQDRMRIVSAIKNQLPKLVSRKK